MKWGFSFNFAKAAGEILLLLFKCQLPVDLFHIYNIDKPEAHRSDMIPLYLDPKSGIPARLELVGGKVHHSQDRTRDVCCVNQLQMTVRI